MDAFLAECSFFVESSFSCMLMQDDKISRASFRITNWRKAPTYYNKAAMHFYGDGLFSKASSYLWAH